ncbi:FAD-binding oxidoreductase [Kyrpidia spormannii]|uniref:D-lactate dehydrogenase (cytochrome) n=2 Tax=Kyrpidia spormannii TaxID=2055160 RepID=A0A6F9DZY4_9BACL|nr:2-hydroxy-acid oxidase [Kyrpidia spormannii]CAB3391025.1 2-hydroxy-acid oxidase [Kyrpidia spormannii]
MTWMEELKTRLPKDAVSVNPTILEQHGRDESYHAPHNPDAVVFAKSRDDVVEVMRIAAKYRVPVIPFAIGSSVEGHVIPVQGGISLDVTAMNQILEIRPEDFLVRVQPGVTRTQLNRALKPYGLFFPVDPGADASLGGMAATNASGTTTVRYGTMRDQVRDLEVVLPGGEVIHTGSLAAKSSSGYHLTGLFVGSEGTLGVFTELWLRVYGLPERVMAIRAEFPDVSGCVKTATAVLGAGIPVARMELVDERIIEAVNAYKGTSYPKVPTLFLEFHGNPEGLERDVQTARELAEEEGCLGFAFDSDEESRQQLWEARHSAARAFMAQYPGRGMMTTDVCVPISKMAQAVTDARELLDRQGVYGAVLGHIGDGNYHALIAVDTKDPEDVARAEAINEQLVEYALACGGTCTGEHGVGLGKRKYQEKEHGRALQVMKAIRSALDPLGIMNPGKLID